MRDRLDVSNGPDKAGLLRAVTNPDEHLHVVFGTTAGLVETHIDVIEETGTDGVQFALRGHVASGELRGADFAGLYDSETRTGRLHLRRVG